MARTIDFGLLNRIETLDLSERNKAWRGAVKDAGWKVSADRERWTVKSWRETEGEDLQIRRAKLLKCVLDNIEIKIHPFDEIVGRLRGSSAARRRSTSAATTSPASGMTAAADATLDASVQSARTSRSCARPPAPSAPLPCPL